MNTKIVDFEELKQLLRRNGGSNSSNSFALGGRYPHPCHTSLPEGVTPSAVAVPDSGGHSRKHMSVDGPVGAPGEGTFRNVLLSFYIGSEMIGAMRDWSTEDGWRTDLHRLAYEGGVWFNSSPPEERAAAEQVMRTRSPA